MIEKVINHKDERGRTVYKIYTKDEADKAGIKYVYWHAAEKGDMTLSDDGYVGKCISAKWYPHDASRRNSLMNKLVTTPYGMAYHKPGRVSPELLAEMRNNYWTISGKNDLVGRRKNRALQIAKLYARTLDLDYSIAEAEKNNPDWGFMRWKKWCKSEEFKEMYSEELTKLLADKGFTRAKTLELLQKAVDMSLNKQNVNALIKIVENLTKMQGMDKPEQTTTTTKIEATKLAGYLDDVSQEEDLVQIRGTQTEVTTKYSNSALDDKPVEIDHEEVSDE